MGNQVDRAFANSYPPKNKVFAPVAALSSHTTCFFASKRSILESKSSHFSRAGSRVHIWRNDLNFHVGETQPGAEIVPFREGCSLLLSGGRVWTPVALPNVQ